MRQTRIFRAESFRFAALFAVVFLILTGALIGTVLWIVEGAERATLVAANDSDIATVTNGLQAEGLDEAIEVVRQRLGAPTTPLANRHRFTPDIYMAIETMDGRVLAGNLPWVSCGTGVFSLAVPATGNHHHPGVAIGRCAPLTAAAVIFVGRDTAAMHAIRERILGAFGWLALGTCAFSMIAGLLLGRRFMARVDAITHTCERVISGKFDERIPVRGRDDEWDRLARAINEMLDRISMLLENLQQVSSDVAHDLRTPLTRLRSRLEAAREGSSGIVDYSAAISRAIGDTDQLLSMFSALLRISQIEAGTRASSFTSVDISGLLNGLYELYFPVAEDSRHTLVRSVQPDLHVRGDRELLTQLFSNLIENAIRHTPAQTQIRLLLEAVNGTVTAAVIDAGPGVAPEDREKVTRRFYRGSASRSAEGHGLGLSLVAAIAQLHGATMRLQDAVPGLRVDLAFTQ